MASSSARAAAGHHVRRPGLTPVESHRDVVYPLDGADRALHLLDEEIPERAAHRSQPHVHEDGAVVDLDLTHHPELDDVDCELRVDDVPEHLHHLGLHVRWHGFSVTPRSGFQ